MNFENVYEICKDNEVLRKFLNDNELLGDYSGICNKCFKGSVYLRQDKSFSKDGLSWEHFQNSGPQKTHNTWSVGV